MNKSRVLGGGEVLTGETISKRPVRSSFSNTLFSGHLRLDRDAEKAMLGLTSLTVHVAIRLAEKVESAI
jgi:hypothetical protein